MSFLAATSSPRRHVILRELGIKDFDIRNVDCEEYRDESNPLRTVQLSALSKMMASLKDFGDSYDWILTADTVVFFKGKVLGKPQDLQEARQMLLSYRGKQQDVFTAVCLYGKGELRSFYVKSSVLFKNYAEKFVDEYIDKVKPLDRAGAYDINTHGDIIIEKFIGSYTNVMGLPADELKQNLLDMGYVF